MELVYVWVEEYKNIRRQGFNFSSRLQCSYNHNPEELTINTLNAIDIEASACISSTGAIIGKNGSGKSSLLEAIIYSRTERLSVHASGTVVITVFLDNNTLYIFTSKPNAFHAFKTFKHKTINNTTYEVFQRSDVSADDLFNITVFTNRLHDFTHQGGHHEDFRSYKFETLYNGYKIYENNIDADFNEKLLRLTGYQSSFFDYFSKELQFDGFLITLSCRTRDYIDGIRGDERSETDKKYEEIVKTLSLNELIMPENLFSLFDRENISQETKNKRIIYIIYKFFSSLALYQTKYCLEHFRRDIDSTKAHNIFLYELDKKLTTRNKNNDRRLFRWSYHDSDHKNRESAIDISMKILKDLETIILEDFGGEHKQKAMLDEWKSFYNDVSFLRHHRILSKIIVNNFKIDNHSLHGCKSEISAKSIKKILRRFHEIDFFHNLVKSKAISITFTHPASTKKTITTMSTGERQIFRLLVDLCYSYSLVGKNIEKEIVFFDEAETTLHPEWQRKFISLIVSSFNKLRSLNLIPAKKTFQLIFITHSPFLISDLPTQNIIFLDRDENGMCKVVDGLKEKKQTFGANIHTLLSDAFFMEDGLIGEFAQGWINEVIQYVENGKETERIKNDEKARQIIDLIGEPIVKNMLQKRLDSRRLGEVDTIRKQIEELTNRLEKLEGDNHDRP